MMCSQNKTNKQQQKTKQKPNPIKSKLKQTKKLCAPPFGFGDFHSNRKQTRTEIGPSIMGYYCGGHDGHDGHDGLWRCLELRV